jgi:tetratricopeptide (TPR) repeat protein
LEGNAMQDGFFCDIINERAYNNKVKYHHQYQSFPRASRRKRSVFFLAGIIILFFIVLGNGCERDKGRDDFVQALITLDNSLYAHQEIDPGLTKEINEIVSLFENDLKEETEANEDLGRLYKRLGTEYMALAELYMEIERRVSPEYPGFVSPRQEDIYNKMRAIRYYNDRSFFKAYESFTRAIELDPGNPLLFYYTGVCAGWIAKSFVEVDRESEREKWLNTAEASYLRAIELDPGYVDALYGYSVLLIIELAREEEGIEYLHQILEKETKHINALFLLARAYYQTMDYDEALNQYDRIIKISSSGEIRDKARLLKEQVKDELYDSEK